MRAVRTSSGTGFCITSCTPARVASDRGAHVDVRRMDDCRWGRALLRRGVDLHAVHAAHAQIEQHHVVFVAFESIERRAPVERGVDLETLQAEHPLQRAHEHTVVVHDEHTNGTAPVSGILRQARQVRPLRPSSNGSCRRTLSRTASPINRA